MLVLHTAQLEERLVLWGEDSAARQDQTNADRHPGCADIDLLLEAIDLPDYDIMAGEATVWLPSKGNTPLPSSPLAGDAPKSRAKPRIRPWRVSAIRLDAGAAAEFLQSCQDRPVLKPGVILGPEVAYWYRAYRFGLSLATRQQYLPTVTGRGDRVIATWKPLFIGDDAHRLAQLASLMPPSARSVTNAAAPQPPTPAASTVLRAFLDVTVDHLVRGALGPDAANGGVDSAHDAWLHSLSSADGIIDAPLVQLQQLRQQVSEWHRPIAAAANAPYRLCIRLEEPPEPADDEAPAIGQGDWYLRYLLQPHDDHSLLLPAETVWKRRRRDARNPDFSPREFLLSSLAQAANLCPPIAASLHGKRPAGQKLPTAGAHQFLNAEAPALQQAGFGVLLPAWWTRRGSRTRPAIRARVKTPSMQGGGHISLSTMLDLDVMVALGDQTITPEELAELAELKTPLVRLRGQWVEINADEIREAADFWSNKQQVSVRDAIHISLDADDRAADDNVSLQTDDWIARLMEQLDGKTQIERPDAPASFQGSLRPYQEAGYAWLTFLRQWGLGACLADDMGLGKTIQTLAALQLDEEEGNERPNLLVCPTSLMYNWQRESAKFTPDLNVMLHHGPGRKRGVRFHKTASNHQIIVTSYGTMLRDAKFLSDVPWRAVILDEAQNIKNPVSRQAQAARNLPADYRVALTGTPVENHVGDLWSIMEFLNPGLLGTQAQFKRNYFVPIQANHDAAAASRLQKATGPFILRRVKTDRSIIDDLPDKHETKQYCSLTREQVTLYEAVLREAEARMEQQEGIQRRGSILDTLTKLKQACNHPRQLLADNSPIAGRSGKMERLHQLLDEIIPNGDRALVFSQFAEMGAIIQRYVQENFGIETPFLHGGVSRRVRDGMVERFQNDPHGPQVFVLSLRAGGSGLNLPRANHVIHYDRWWNPAVENQATDRAFRIGQTKDVHVHKLICAGTLEDHIDAMIEAKGDTAERVVGGNSERWLTELSNAELREVLALSLDHADD
ncbi:MAG: DEAD/DEAH box helicase [Chloroflexota bacterium]|nr:DEAD/DEAH box helicase [Chloroflexota bacterium]MDE2961172.1 DEAD/DEAH box helicase [Chloroflexota bacterium]